MSFSLGFSDILSWLYSHFASLARIVLDLTSMGSRLTSVTLFLFWGSISLFPGTVFQAQLVLAWPSLNPLFLQASLGSSVGRLLCPVAAFSKWEQASPCLGFGSPCHAAAMLCWPCRGACLACPSGVMLFSPCSGAARLLLSAQMPADWPILWGRGCNLVLKRYTYYYIKNCWQKVSSIHVGFRRLESEAVGYHFYVPNLLKFWRNYLSFALGVYRSLKLG